MVINCPGRLEWVLLINWIFSLERVWEKIRTLRLPREVIRGVVCAWFVKEHERTRTQATFNACQWFKLIQAFSSVDPAIDDLKSKAVLSRILPLPGVLEPERWSGPWVKSWTEHEQQLCRVKWYIGDTWSYMEMLVFVKAGTLIYSPDSSMCLGPNLSRLLAYLTNTTDSPSATRVPLCSRSIPKRERWNDTIGCAGGVFIHINFRSIFLMILHEAFHAQVHHIYFLSYRCILFCYVKKDMTVGSRLGLYPDCICFILFLFTFLQLRFFHPSIIHVPAKVGQQSMPK